MLLTNLVVLISAFGLATAQAERCSQLKGYAPALLHCAVKYPVAAPTVTSTRTTIVTLKATKTPKTTTTTRSSFNFSTTRSATSGEVRTITAVELVTITNCDNMPRPTCTKKSGSPNLKQSPSVAEEMDLKRSEALEERDASAHVTPRSLNLLAQILAWVKVLASGESTVRNVCACIQPPPSRTVTTYATVTVTQKV